MKAGALAFTLFLTQPNADSVQFCFEKVENAISREIGGSASIDIDFYSPGDITQKVIGPLRRNQLTEREENEVEALLKARGIEFYQLTLWKEAKFRSELLIVNARTCNIEKRYVLLDGAEG